MIISLFRVGAVDAGGALVFMAPLRHASTTMNGADDVNVKTSEMPAMEEVAVWLGLVGVWLVGAWFGLLSLRA